MVCINPLYVCDHVSTVIKEYGLEVCENKSKVVCKNGIRGIRKWTIGSTNIDETQEYKYLGVTVKEGPNGGFKSMVVRMKEANVVCGMVKLAASRSESKFVIGSRVGLARGEGGSSPPGPLLN